MLRREAGMASSWMEVFSGIRSSAFSVALVVPPLASPLVSGSGIGGGGGLVLRHNMATGPTGGLVAVSRHLPHPPSVHHSLARPCLPLLEGPTLNSATGLPRGLASAADPVQPPPPPPSSSPSPSPSSSSQASQAGPPILRTILSEEQRALIRDERRVLTDLHAASAKVPHNPEELALLASSIAQLDDNFLVTVVGEFNSGKSSFINALLGKLKLQSGMTPTTAQINVIRFGAVETEASPLPDGMPDVLYTNMNVEWLKDINIVDTPGTNAVFKRHQEITEHFIPKSDLVIFVSSVFSPFSESEKEFMMKIKNWGKKIVVVLNKADGLEDEKQVTQVVDFVKTNVQLALEVEPKVFVISAQKALDAKVAGVAVPRSSGFVDIETYLLKTLDSGSRIRLKLEAPLGIAASQTRKAKEVAARGLAVLHGDLAALQKARETLAEQHAASLREVSLQKERIDYVLLKCKDRADAFFDETFSLTNVFGLLQSSKVKSDFDSKVVADFKSDIHRYVNEFARWCQGQRDRQWKTVQYFMKSRSNDRPRTSEWDSALETVESHDPRRGDALATIATAVASHLTDFDKAKEAEKISDSVSDLVVKLGGFNSVGAAGTMAASLMAVDWSGAILLSTLAASAIILPYQSRTLSIELKKKLSDLQRALSESVDTIYTREMQGTEQELADLLKPYQKFAAERVKEHEAHLALLAKTEADLKDLRDRIRRLV